MAAVVAVVMVWTLASAYANSSLAPVVSAQTDAGLGPPILTDEVDRDLDGWIDTIEDGLGSDAADNASLPESIAIPVSCWDGLDNDSDGAIDDEDAGCQPMPALTGIFPDAGQDIFESTIDLNGYGLQTAFGICDIDFSGTGPVIVERTAPSGGDGSQREFGTEMLSMQLTGIVTLLPGTACNQGQGPLTVIAILIEDYSQASLGSVSSQDATGAADYPADSFFDIHFQVATPIGLLSGGPPGGPAGAPVRVTNVVNSMPPYHSPANPHLNPDCYTVDRAGHVHCPKPPLDHFLCYTGEFPAGGADDVQLSDQFGRSLSSVGPADRFCNATSKNSLAIFDEGAHLERFAFGADDTGKVPRRVLVTNQFGPQELAVGRPVGLFVPSQKGTEVPPAALDHFKCYAVEGTAPGRAVTLADQFSAGQVRKGSVGLPRTLCNPVAKTHDGIVTPVADSNWHLVCYDVQTDARADRSVRVRNQFVDHSPALRAAVELCVPSMKRILPKKEPPPKRHPKLPGTAKYWKIGGSRSFPAEFNVPFVFKSTKPCTYDQLEFYGFQKNKKVVSGPSWVAYRDTEKNSDEVTIIFFDRQTGLGSGVIVTAPGKQMPGNKGLVEILEEMGPQLAESLETAADHQMPAGLLSAFGVKDGAVYYGEYKFRNKKKAKAEMGDFFDRLAEETGPA